MLNISLILKRILWPHVWLCLDATVLTGFVLLNVWLITDIYFAENVYIHTTTDTHSYLKVYQSYIQFEVINIGISFFVSSSNLTAVHSSYLFLTHS
jgi:hypothetical protein